MSTHTRTCVDERDCEWRIAHLLRTGTVHRRTERIVRVADRTEHALQRVEQQQQRRLTEQHRRHLQQYAHQPPPRGLANARIPTGESYDEQQHVLFHTRQARCVDSDRGGLAKALVSRRRAGGGARIDDGCEVACEQTIKHGQAQVARAARVCGVAIEISHTGQERYKAKEKKKEGQHERKSHVHADEKGDAQSSARPRIRVTALQDAPIEHDRNATAHCRPHTLDMMQRQHVHERAQRQRLDRRRRRGRGA